MHKRGSQPLFPDIPEQSTAVQYLASPEHSKSSGAGLSASVSGRFRKSPALAGCSPKLQMNDFSKSFAFGSPSKPSPLDKIRPVMQNFLSNFDDNADLNATFPRAAVESAQRQESTLSNSFGTGPIEGLRGRDRLAGLGLDSVQFNSGPIPDSRIPSSSTQEDYELNASANWAMKSFIVSNGEICNRNPNKALLTINRSGIILIANEVAGELISCQPSELVGSKISTYFSQNRQFKSASVEEVFINEDGTLGTVSGKVHTVIDKSGQNIPVSVWAKKITDPSVDEVRFLVALERIARFQGWAAWDEIGRIVAHDVDLLLLLGYQPHHSLLLKPITTIFDSINQTTANSIQQVTCRTSQGLSFPATVEVAVATINDKEKITIPNIEGTIFCGFINVYGSLSGLVSFDANGTIFGCNETFVSLMFGQTNASLQGQKITILLPKFHEETTLNVPISPIRSINNSGNINESVKSLDQSNLTFGNNIQTFRVLEGTYIGQAKHSNGVVFNVNYQVKRIVSDNDDVYCVWISRTDQSSLTASLKANEHVAVQQIVNEEISPLAGEFLENFDALEKIGTGAFGFVQVAMRKSNDEEVVVKFLKKSKVLVECWEINNNIVELPHIDGDQYEGRIPREILLLLTLKHPNICKLLQVFHNRDYYQMVMTRTGPTFDLFEFIDENPEVDEPVASFVFRQVVSAVSYLHSNHILHRDIKDENIILDLNFHVQVIDFGSAAFMEPGKLFDTFCGTLEYCAPEVLLGNPYPGPELEIFSMGVTLYTLVFAENPFFDVEETINGILRPPFQPSSACIDILAGLLEPNPKLRMKMHEIVSHPWITQDVSNRIRQITSDPNWKVDDAPFGADVIDPGNDDNGEDDDEIQDDEIDAASKRLYDSHILDSPPMKK